VIDPGKLADAAAMHVREAQDRLRHRAHGFADIDGPMRAATTSETEAACDEIRAAFIAGARLASAGIATLQAQLDEAEDDREYERGLLADMTERAAAT
jgi:hypothetical protein